MRIKTLHASKLDPNPPKDLNKRYNKLVIIGQIKTSKEAKILCQCDCGWRIIARLEDLKKGKTSSCGCSKGYSKLPKLTDKITIGKEEMYFFQYIQRVDLDIDTIKKKITRQKKTLKQVYEERTKIK